MRHLTTQEVLESFPFRQRKKVKLCKLDDVQWDSIEYLSWFHTSGHLAYIVFEASIGVRGLILEKKSFQGRRASMCSWCKTVHGSTGIATFSVSRVNNPASVIGDFVCVGLDCSAHIRGTGGVNSMRETIDLEQKAERLRSSLDDFFVRAYQ